MNYTGTWGLYQCFQGIDDEMVNSDCREDFLHYSQMEKFFNVYQCKKRRLIGKTVLHI